MPFDETLGIPKDVWKDMGPRAQELACNAARLRKLLATTPLLVRAGATMPVKDAGGLGITVLHESSGTVELGVGDVPAVPMDIIESHNPKGAC